METPNDAFTALSPRQTCGVELLFKMCTLTTPCLWILCEVIIFMLLLVSASLNMLIQTPSEDSVLSKAHNILKLDP